MINQMVEQSVALDRAFSALADGTRRSLLAQLERGEAGVTELAEGRPMSLQAVSKHLRVLEDAGLVVRRIEGRRHRLRLVKGGLDEVREWIERHRRFWDARLDELEKQLASPPKRARRGLPKKGRRG